MSKFKSLLKRRISIIIAILILLPAVIAVSASEMPSNQIDQKTIELKEMVCRIKNVESGLYLDTYKYTLKTQGKSYVEKYSESSLGQVFHLSPNEDGTYFIIPQSDGAEYIYSYSSKDTDKRISKISKSSIGANSKFDISLYNNSYFIIAPSNFADKTAVLTQSTNVSNYKDYYTELLPFEGDSKSQLWIIEPIATENISVIYTNTKVRLYTSGQFFARKYPYNVFSHDISWKSSNEDVLMVGANGEWCALSVGTAKVTASVDGVSKTFKVTVSDKDAFTWYSQNNIYTSDWDATQLLYLSFTSDGVTKKFAIDSKDPGGNNCWMDEGCGNASMAMVLNNMGATMTNGYDFRSGQTGNLIADPYTVALANSGNYGYEPSVKTLKFNPIYMRWANVASRFNVDGRKLEFTRKYNPTLAHIRDLLKEHPEGVIVQLSIGSSKNHYLVFTECLNPNEKYSSNLKFMVCDSAARSPEEGDYVPFEKSTSYVIEGYRYKNIKSVAYFSYAE